MKLSVEELEALSSLFLDNEGWKVLRDKILKNFLEEFKARVLTTQVSKNTTSELVFEKARLEGMEKLISKLIEFEKKMKVPREPKIS